MDHAGVTSGLPKLGLGILAHHFNARVSEHNLISLSISSREEAAAANRILVQAGLPVYQLYQQNKITWNPYLWT